jgi:hypothetical protein
MNCKAGSQECCHQENRRIMTRKWPALSLPVLATSSKVRGQTRFGISLLYFEPGITITRVALSSFFAGGELPRVTIEEPSGEVDQEAQELLRV